MGMNKRVRKKFAARLGSEHDIVAVVALQRDINGVAPTGGIGGGGCHGAYLSAHGLVDSFATPEPLDQQWCVLTRDRLLLFHKKASSLSPNATKGALEHDLERGGITLRWGDYKGGRANLRIRLLALTLPDGRCTVQNTILGSALKKANYFDEADTLIEAFGPAAQQIDMEPYQGAP